MYSRIIEGGEYTFGVSGKLIMNVMVMYDRQTDSLWSQLIGEAVEGPLEGAKLEYLPSWQTTWADWKAQHPDTVAIKKGFAGPLDPYSYYYKNADLGVLGESRFDERVYPKGYVVGVELDGDTAAYPFSLLNEMPVVNDVVGEQPVLIVFNADTGTGVAYDRRVDGRTLTFVLEQGLILTDTETGTRWDGLTGQGMQGALAGESLTRLKSTSAFWFGWKDWYPHTRLYRGEE